MDEEKKGFNKLQWSKTSKDGEMYVVRSDDQAEFDLLVAKYRGKLGGTFTTPQVVQNPQATSQTAKAESDVCDKCGGEKVLNPKTGKMFCKDKCWLNL